MDKKYSDIINNGKKTGKKISEINAELKAAGANFHLDPTMGPDGVVSDWTEKEIKEGFIQVEGTNETSKTLRDYMKYDPAMSGKSKVVSVPGAKYEITWNENGNPVKAIKL